MSTRPHATLPCMNSRCASMQQRFSSNSQAFPSFPEHSTVLLWVMTNRPSSQKGSHPLAVSVKENTQHSQRTMPKAVEGSLNAAASQHKVPVQRSIAVQVAFSFYFAPTQGPSRPRRSAPYLFRQKRAALSQHRVRVQQRNMSAKRIKMVRFAHTKSGVCS